MGMRVKTRLANIRNSWLSVDVILTDMAALNFQYLKYSGEGDAVQSQQNMLDRNVFFITQYFLKIHLISFYYHFHTSNLKESNWTHKYA